MDTGQLIDINIPIAPTVGLRPSRLITKAISDIRSTDFILIFERPPDCRANIQRDKDLYPMYMDCWLVITRVSLKINGGMWLIVYDQQPIYSGLISFFQRAAPDNIGLD